MFEMPIVETQKCNGCGLCVTVCNNNAFKVVNNVVIVIPQPDCDWCGRCEVVCPVGAISRPFEIVFG